MKKILKIFVIVIIALFLIWCMYVIVDCIRLRNAKFGTKPLIVLNENSLELKDNIKPSNNKYTGLGYTIDYRYYIDENSTEDIIILAGKSAEFRLFDSILIWAWIE